MVKIYKILIPTDDLEEHEEFCRILDENNIDYTWGVSDDNG